MNYATRNNVVCVASTGNAGTQALVYSAAYGNVLCVTSVNAQGLLSTFSNYGPDITAVTAPGEDLVTTYPGENYAAVSGTSFAAALISGAVSGLLTPAPPGGNTHLLPLPLSPFYVLQSFASAGSANKVVGAYGVINHAAAAKRAQQYAQQQWLTVCRARSRHIWDGDSRVGLIGGVGSIINPPGLGLQVRGVEFG